MPRSTFAAMKRSERRQEARHNRLSSSNDEYNEQAVRRRKHDKNSDNELSPSSSKAATVKKEPPVHRLYSSARTDTAWTPNVSAVFKLLVSVRISAAIWSPMNDCDEVYNYWEPLHLWLYGNGMQTWEYSPVYAIRSYLYILLHYIPVMPFHALLPHTKIMTFFYIRCFLAFTQTLAELYLYRAIWHRLGAGVARYYLVATVCATGMFLAAPAFLPSSFALSMHCIVFGAVLNSQQFIGVAATAVGALVGWPFAALIGLPVVVDAVIKSREKWRPLLDLIIYSAVCGILLSALLVTYDSHYYGRRVLAPLNIILYNVFTPHGPSLYGTAPLSYYLLNLFLNWNVFVMLCVIASPVTAVAIYATSETHRSNSNTALGAMLPVFYAQLTLFVWCAVFFTQAHKEERFLFPIYPLIALSAALTLYGVERLLMHMTDNATLSCSFPATITIFFALLSASRIVSMYRNYHAPFDIYIALNERLIERAKASNLPEALTVCTGKEWHRFPSSFFIPPNDLLLQYVPEASRKRPAFNTTVTLRFVKSEFAGLLPGYYNGSLSFPAITRAIPTTQNDANREEFDRYVDVADCDYMIDLQTPTTTPLEPDYASDVDHWQVVKTERFLLAQYSDQFYRAFYIPYKTRQHIHTGNYVLLERVRAVQR